MRSSSGSTIRPRLGIAAQPLGHKATPARCPPCRHGHLCPVSACAQPGLLAEEELSEEDQKLKDDLELMVTRVGDADGGVQKLAVESLGNEIRWAVCRLVLHVHPHTNAHAPGLWMPFLPSSQGACRIAMHWEGERPAGCASRLLAGVPGCGCPCAAGLHL